jgi:mRNA interferase MazF
MKSIELNNLKRGQIVLANLNYMNTKNTSLQQGIRPVVIVSNERCNKFSTVVTVIPLTSNLNKCKLPTHVKIGLGSGLKNESVALCEQQQSLDKSRLMYLVGECNEFTMRKVNKAIMTQLDIMCEYEERKYAFA